MITYSIIQAILTTLDIDFLCSTHNTSVNLNNYKATQSDLPTCPPFMLFQFFFMRDLNPPQLAGCFHNSRRTHDCGLAAAVVMSLIYATCSSCEYFQRRFRMHCLASFLNSFATTRKSTRQLPPTVKRTLATCLCRRRSRPRLRLRPGPRLLCKPLGVCVVDSARSKASKVRRAIISARIVATTRRCRRRLQCNLRRGN